MLGGNVYQAIQAQDGTRIGDLLIKHASTRRLPEKAPKVDYIVTPTALERLRFLEDRRRTGRFPLIFADPGSGTTPLLRAFSRFARLDLFSQSAFPEAEESDLLGGRRLLAGQRNRMGFVRGVLSWVAEAPALGVLDNVGAFRPGVLPSVLNPICDFRRVTVRSGLGKLFDTPWNPESFLVLTAHERSVNATHPLPADTVNRFQRVMWTALPDKEEKQIAHLRYNLPENILNAIWDFHVAMVTAVKKTTEIGEDVRPFSRRDFHRLCQATRLFCEFHDGNLFRSAFANALDIYLSRISSPEARAKLRDTHVANAFGKNRPNRWPPIDLRRTDAEFTIGDVTLPVSGPEVLDPAISETPWLLNQMRLAMKAYAMGLHFMAVGPTSIGKSTAVRRVFQRLGANPVIDHFRHGMSGDDLLGTYVEGSEAGTYMHETSFFARALQSGMPTIVDELDNMSLSGQAYVNAALGEGRVVLTQAPASDDQAHSTVPTLEAGEGFWLATSRTPVGIHRGRVYSGKNRVLPGLAAHFLEISADYDNDQQATTELRQITRHGWPEFTKRDECALGLAKLIVELDAFMIAGKICAQQADQDYPTKRWVREVVKGTLRRAELDAKRQPMERYLASEVRWEILERFLGKDRDEVAKLIAQHLPYNPATEDVAAPAAPAPRF